jgi:hypothetical protein
MELPFLTVNYDTLTNDDYTTLNQKYEYEQCHHPTEWEIKEIPLLLDLPSYKFQFINTLSSIYLTLIKC